MTIIDCTGALLFMSADAPRGERVRPTLRPLRSLRWRIPQFLVGLGLCSTGVFLSLQVGLGVSPWDVLHGGIADVTGLSFGVVVIAAGLAILLASMALGVRPGWGTLVNVVTVGVALDRLLAGPILDDLHTAPVVLRVALLALAVLLLGVGVALYLGAGFGAGPRDGLMVAAALHGLAIGPARLVIELTALGLGWLLGGQVGIGTVVMALCTAPAVAWSFRLLGQSPLPREVPARAAAPVAAGRRTPRRSPGRG